MKPGFLVWEWDERRSKSRVMQLFILPKPKSLLIIKEIGMSPITLIPDDDGKDSLQNVGNLIHSYRYS
jgi:hypothetical protein